MSLQLFNKFGVQTSSASAFSPADISGVQLILEADVGITQLSNKVSRWTDTQSGTNRYVEQNFEAAKPTLIVNDPAFNNKDTLHFNSSSIGLLKDSESLGITLNHTVYIVHRATSASTNYYLNINEPAATAFGVLFYKTNVPDDRYIMKCSGSWTQDYILTGGTIVDTPHFIRYKRDGLNMYLNRNGGTDATDVGTSGNINYNTASPRLTVGMNTNATGSTGAKISAIYVFNKALSVAEESDMKSYIDNKWGL